jgi:acyl-CoA thioesterase
MKKSEAIVGRMFDHDAFSQWLGIERVSVSEGSCELRMTVRPEMCNGFEVLHGGISYSLADSALAFASNSHGRKSMSIDTSISHIATGKSGDILTAIAREDSLKNRIAIYTVEVTNQRSELVALFKGTVYRSEKEWDV